MSRTRLKDVVRQQKSSLKLSDLKKHGAFPVFGASGLVGYRDCFQSEKEAVAIIKDGAGIGRVSMLPKHSSVLGTIQMLEPKEGISNSYLFYFLSHLNLGKSFTGSTIPHIYFKNYSDSSFPDVSYNQQCQVAEKLDAIRKSIEQKNNQLSVLESLVKSRFIEMFGDKGFSEKNLAEYCFGNGAYGAQSASAPFQEGRPRYVRITDINDDGSLNDDVVCSINESDDMDYKLEYGDFLFARMGATVGKTYAFITGSQIYAGYCIRFKLDTSKINPRYLFWLTKQENYWRWVKENQSGAAQPGINAKKYGSLPVPNAPIDLQNQFASFVELIDKSRFDQRI